MYKFKSEQFKSTLYCNEMGVPYLLPCLFSQYLHEHKEGFVVKWSDSSINQRIKEAEIEAVILSDETIQSISNQLGHFINWFEQYSLNKKHIQLSLHHNVPEEILNHYINTVLVNDLGKSEEMVNQAKTALRHYYNYLAFNGFTNRKTINFNNAPRAIARQNTQKRRAVKYLPADMRATLYNSATTIRDECILKNSGECGLRTKENIGILVKDFRVGNNTYQGVKSFFDIIDSEKKNNVAEDELQQVFKFWLQGRFSKGKRNKGGQSRWIYIKRDLMLRYKAYFEKERPHTTSDSLFVTQHGNTIGVYQGSRCFSKVRALVLNKQELGQLPDYFSLLEKDHTYHCLRHSFATDKFYDAALENGLEFETVSCTHQPYRLVAELLGHTSQDPAVQTKTTSTYIHLCHDKLRFERKI